MKNHALRPLVLAHEDVDTKKCDLVTLVYHKYCDYFFHTKSTEITHKDQVDGLMQERHNSIANTLELRLSYTNPSKWCVKACCLSPTPIH